MAALTVLSFGIYVPLWFGLSWAELRRETGDEEMRPAAHAASIFIPGYGAWQVYRHFALIAQALARAGSHVKVDPYTAALGVTVWWITWLHYSSEPLFVALNVVELIAGTTVVVYGQRALNACWSARPGQAAQGGVLPVDWLALGLAATFFVLVLLGNLTAPSN